jgi:hypothetical protein
LNYHEAISKVFLINEEALIENLFVDKPALTDVLKEKEQNRTNWDDFLDDLKKIRPDYSLVRDCEPIGQRHSFYGLFTYDKGYKAIIFSVSFPFRAMGFRFAMFDETPPSSNAGKREIREILSYFPIDSDMVALLEDIKKCMVSHFPDFEIFDNRNATQPVGLVLIDCDIYQNIELWKVLFSTGGHGIL